MRWLLLAFVLLAVVLGGCSEDDPGDNEEGSIFPSPVIHTPNESTPTALASPTEAEEQTDTSAPTSPPSQTFPEPAQRGPHDVGGVVLTFEAEDDAGEGRRVDTVVWYPAAESGEIDPVIEAARDVELAEGGPFPLVVFSHGDGGNPLQSTFFTTHLASHGFVVAAVSHTGGALRDCFPCIDLEGDDASFDDRLDDISTAMGGLLAANSRRGLLREAIDLERAAIVGHSFGGHTTLLSLARDLFQVGVALAPVELDLEESQLEDIEVPVLIMGGGLDDTASFRIQQQLYANLDDTEASLLVELPEGGHLSFTDYCFAQVPGCRPGDIDPITARLAVNHYVTAFLRLYLAGDEGYRSFLLEDVRGARIVESDRIE